MSRIKVAILNGNPNADNGSFDDYLQRLSDELTSGGHTVTVFGLREMDVKYCTGCFGCWVKTPGECVVKDESRNIRRAVINADFVLWASPVRMGFYSALLKTVTDKLTPLLLPYGEIAHGETRHVARYEQYPVQGLLLEKGPGTDDEDIQIISTIQEQTALDYKSRLAFTKSTYEPVVDVARAITAGTGTGGNR
jgi:multimeric flavodoxin WrbA